VRRVAVSVFVICAIAAVGVLAVASRGRGRTAARPEVVDAMSIAGVVFRASNWNGRIDSGEPPVRNASIRIRNPLTRSDQQVATGSDGSFRVAVGALGTLSCRSHSNHRHRGADASQFRFA
jgi:hypothetical protein